MALEIKNQQVFNKVVSQAVESAITNCQTGKMAKRWERAIDRAVKEIEENPYLHYDADENHLVILSSSSNNIYSANGVCGCLSYQNGKLPCWHRAAARIWRLYLEAENTPPPIAAAIRIESNNAPYLKPATGRKPEWIGGCRV